MSASMHPEVAQAAARLAAEAKPLQPHAAEVIAAANRAKPALAELKAKILARMAQQPDQPSPAAQAWRAIPLQCRILLAMPLADGDPEQIANTPWGQLTAEQRHSLGVIARDMRRATERASLLR